MGAKMVIRNSDDLMEALDLFDKANKISRDEFLVHMKLITSIKCCDWSGLFDELDVDKNGTLSYSEFWAKKAIKSSKALMDALNQFTAADKDNNKKFQEKEFTEMMKKQQK